MASVTLQCSVGWAYTKNEVGDGQNKQISEYSSLDFNDDSLKLSPLKQITVFIQ